MRKIFIIILFVSFSASSVKANIFFDVFGLYNNTGYAKSQTAPGSKSGIPGFTVGVNVTRDFSFILRGFESSVKKNANEPDESNYFYMMTAGGIEYNLPIPIDSRYVGLGWRSSFVLGYSRTEIEKKNLIIPGSFKESDNGMAVEFTTGIQINFTQHLSAFVDFGYHKNYYSGKFEKKNISGTQAMAGFRYYLFNIKNIGDNY